MFKIRAEQMEAFNQAGRKAFENEMVAHSQEFSPKLSKVLGEEQLRIAIRRAVKNADSYGFTNRGPVRLFIELMFLYGSGFDSDPQFRPIGEYLSEPSDQMDRAEKIYQYVITYQDQVSGPDNANVRKSLEYLDTLVRNPLTFTAENFAFEVLEEMRSAFPQRIEFIGKEGMDSLIQAGRTKASEIGFHSLRSQALLIVLMFAFGHRCTDDPLYPWISNTISNETISDAQTRATRLEKKSATWLKHVLARPNGGAS